MHRYEQKWPDDHDDWELPVAADFVYRDARDVAEFASRDPLTTWRTWPEIWHLDVTGRWCCCSKGSSLDSMSRYAESPERLIECRLTPTGEQCPDYWVVASRIAWMPAAYDLVDGEVDSFISLRTSLSLLGVSLLDVVVFRDDFHWWSLHELACGTTEWEFAAPLGHDWLN